MALLLFGLGPEAKAIWLGIPVPTTVGTGLRAPPVRLMTVQVVNRIARDGSMSETCKGVRPWLASGPLRRLVLLLLPSLAQGFVALYCKSPRRGADRPRRMTRQSMKSVREKRLASGQALAATEAAGWCRLPPSTQRRLRRTFADAAVATTTRPARSRAVEAGSGTAPTIRRPNCRPL